MGFVVAEKQARARALAACTRAAACRCPILPSFIQVGTLLEIDSIALFYLLFRSRLDMSTESPFVIMVGMLDSCSARQVHYIYHTPNSNVAAHAAFLRNGFAGLTWVLRAQFTLNAATCIHRTAFLLSGGRCPSSHGLLQRAGRSEGAARASKSSRGGRR
jgi:hypothetical protein